MKTEELIELALEVGFDHAGELNMGALDFRPEDNLRKEPGPEAYPLFRFCPFRTTEQRRFPLIPHRRNSCFPARYLFWFPALILFRPLFLLRPLFLFSALFRLPALILFLFWLLR